VLYEDRDLLVVDKPAGLTVIPARDEPPEACLRFVLERARGERLWVVHRIDRDTSGVLLFARHAAAHRTLSLAFERHLVHKTYLAWTRGRPPSAQGRIDTPLHPARKGKMRPAREGEPGALASETGYTVRNAWCVGERTLACVEASPRTGRQHQIRVHLRSIETPLLVDPLYGGTARLEPGALGEGSPALERLTLHAWRLALPHPREARTLHLEAPSPPDLAALEAWLARQS
jgi:tRNA pseudouridine32 synthase/23S rRNA pseudouridine746 synthase